MLEKRLKNRLVSYKSGLWDMGCSSEYQRGHITTLNMMMCIVTRPAERELYVVKGDDIWLSDGELCKIISSRRRLDGVINDDGSFRI